WRRRGTPAEASWPALAHAAGDPSPQHSRRWVLAQRAEAHEIRHEAKADDADPAVAILGHLAFRLVAVEVAMQQQDDVGVVLKLARLPQHVDLGPAFLWSLAGRGPRGARHRRSADNREPVAKGEFLET